MEGGQHSYQVAARTRQILTLTTSLGNGTKVAAQALINLLDREKYQPEAAARIDDIDRQFVDLMKNQQAIIRLLQNRFDDTH